MGTRTIGLDDEAYERLDALKREDESFSDAVKRITGAVSADWRRSFGKYGGEVGDRLAAATERSRTDTSVALAASGEDTLGRLLADTEGRVEDTVGRDDASNVSDDR